MNLFLATLGDPIWQVGGAILALIALVLTLALRSVISQDKNTVFQITCHAAKRF